MKMRTVLYHGDCYEVLPQLIEQGVKVDLILTDPPYIVSSVSHIGKKGTQAGRLGMKYKEMQDFANGFDYDTLFDLFKQISGQYVIFCSNQQLGTFLHYWEQQGAKCTTTVWHKTNAIPNANNRYISDVEYCIYVNLYGGAFQKDNTIPLSFQSRVKEMPFVAGSQRVHPTEKPIPLIDQYVLLHSKENDTILDCFMGSGTTGVSAVKNNRNFIGIEKEKKYFDIAQQRINAENNQTKLTDFFIT